MSTAIDLIEQDYTDMRNTAIDYFTSIVEHRSRKLYEVFLTKGYECTTVSSVTPQFYERLQYCKLLLGMRITLHDDLADNPRYFNPELLQRLINLPLHSDLGAPSVLNESEEEIYELASFLNRELCTEILEFPNFRMLREVFEFDLECTDLATKYSAVMGMVPEIANFKEMQTFGPFNMGMVAAGTLDLMAISELDRSQLGQAREIFMLAQRLGRISNMISTYQREVKEGDLTNEIVLYRSQNPHLSFPVQKATDDLKAEFAQGLNRLQKLQGKADFSLFDLSAYKSGVEKLHELHLQLVGII